MTDGALGRESSGTGGAAARADAEVLDLDVVYQAEFAWVWRTLQRLGVPASDVEDLVHDVFVVVHRRREDYDAARPLRPWLFGIALRVAAKHRRRPQLKNEISGEIEVVDPTIPADEQLAARQTRDTVLQTLQQLDLKRRAVLVMSDIDECSAPEIAAALQIPLNTVYSRLRSARQKFAAAVRRLRAIAREEP